MMEFLKALESQRKINQAWLDKGDQGIIDCFMESINGKRNTKITPKILPGKDEVNGETNV